LIKITYIFEDNNFNKRIVNLYINKKSFAAVKVKVSLQDSEIKIFYLNGKLNNKFIEYDEDGNIIDKILYKKSKIKTRIKKYLFLKFYYI